MQKYKCTSCQKEYFEIDLVKSKCSENQVGNYVSDICPKCYGKIVKVDEIRKELNNVI